MGGFVKNGLVILLLTIVLLVLIEGVLRALFPAKVTEVPATPPLAYAFNEDYLVALKPEMKKAFGRMQINGGYVTHWRTNPDAFRGEPLREDPGHRVMVYGDSNVQARFSGARMTYVGRLAEALERHGYPDVEVINAGIVGAGPDQNLIRMRSDLDRYRPDLVILHIFADNDFGDLLRNRLFDLDADGNLVETTHARTVDELILYNQQERDKEKVSTFLTLRAAKKVVSLFVEDSLPAGDEIENPFGAQAAGDSPAQMMEHLLRRSEEEYAVYRAQGARAYSHFDDHYDIDIAVDPGLASSQAKRELMAAVLREADRLAQAHDVRLLVLVQPSAKDMAAGNSNFDYRHLSGYPGYRRTNLAGSVAAICRDAGIAHVDLYPVFSANRPEELYFEGGDDHWNDRGQQFAAASTAAYITRQALLGPVPAGAAAGNR